MVLIVHLQEPTKNTMNKWLPWVEEKALIQPK